MSFVKPLYETDSYMLFSEFEDAFLWDKDLNKEVWTISMYGDPKCGIIGLNNEWAAVGGEYLAVWVNGTLHTIDDRDLEWIHSFRHVDEYKFEILIDPWAKNSAIWIFDITTLEKTKVRDFKDYHGKPYEENIQW